MKDKVKEALNFGYVRMFRNIINWEWYTDVPCKVLFFHCLFLANHSSKKWQGKTIKRGSFVSSLSKLSSETGLSIQQVRTALKKLKSTQDLTYTSTSHFTLVNVRAYCDWQNDEELSNTVNNTICNIQSTYNQHTINKQITTTNKVNNIEREYRKNFEILIKYAELKGAKSPTAYASKILKETSEENLKNVVESLQKEIEKIEKMNAKIKLQKEQAEKEKMLEHKEMSEETDEELLEFYEKMKNVFVKGKQITPVVEAKNELIKRGLLQ